MEIIGKQIKKYRMEKGITQEQLGELVNVTTQAVSKWERGGTPDIEILPKLAEVLSVSIDTLFGVGEEDFLLSLSRRIHDMPKDEAYRFSFTVCWAIANGVAPFEVGAEHLSDSFFARTSAADCKDHNISKIMQDEGMTTVRFSPDFNYSFLMKEPKNGIKSRLADIETLRKVFAVFADKNILNIIFYMYSRLNTPLSTSLISKNTGISETEVDICMETLCNHKLATKSVIETADGELNSYIFTMETAVIPLLCFADEITRHHHFDFLWSCSRTKPLLK